MTARIDLDELEQRARSIQTIFAGCEINGHIRAHAEDVLALIAAVRALREIRGKLNQPGFDECPHTNPEECPWASEHALVATCDAALAAFDFKEEANGEAR